MNFQDICKELIVVQSNFCILCLRERKDRKLGIINIRKQDQDLLPFSRLGVPVCITCSSVYDDVDYEMVLSQLDKLLTTKEHVIIDERFNPISLKPS